MAPHGNTSNTNLTSISGEFDFENKIINLLFIGNKIGQPIPSRSAKVKTIKSNQIKDLGISKRLAELAQLSDGWLNGKGLAIVPDGIKWLEKNFNIFYKKTLCLPRLYPTAEGAIQAEWSINEWEITLEINLHKKIGEYQAINLLTQEERNYNLDLTLAASWVKLNQEIADFGGSAE